MLVMVPTAVGTTTMVLVAVPPGARSPRSKVTVLPDWLTVPAVVVAEMKDTPPGNVSVIVTAVDVAAPTLVTVSVYVTWSPRVTGSGASFLVRTRAGTKVCWVLVPWVVLGSGSLDETLAVLVMVPVTVGTTTSVPVAMPPGARSPRSKVTVLPDWLTVPAVVVAETKDTPPGNVSLILTRVEVAVPTLVTASV